MRHFWVFVLGITCLMLVDRTVADGSVSRDILQSAAFMGRSFDHAVEHAVFSQLALR